ncbi:MAG TPA: lipoxygenase family protein [Thermoanaerobaculia bacterium]|nr:lipoxygenase family protein [Thermoanaerobaculia bacterium]
MVMLREIVSELFMCLGPLQSCEDAVQDNCVDPIQDCIIDPYVDNCVDPVKRALEVNPLGCVPCLGVEPSLPQYDTAAQQDSRAAQLARTQPKYQYNYSLMRTFHVVERDGEKVGIQGEGVAVLESLPFSQLPSLCWIVLVVQHALTVLDNMALVLELAAKKPKPSGGADDQAVTASRSARAKDDPNAGTVDEPCLAEVVSGDLSPRQVERAQEDLANLRTNLFGTMNWGRRTIAQFRVDGGDAASGQSAASNAPVTETAPASGFSLCPCPRCSPEAFTRELFDNITNDLTSIFEKILELPALNRRPLSIKAYNELFQKIPLPQFALTFRDDEMFALQRIGGQNPVVIQRVEWTDAWSKKFPVTSEQYVQTMGEGDSLQAAGRDGRLYICDYEESLGNSIAGDFPTFAGQKYINAPLAMFALSKDDRRIIKAVAIQANQKPGPANPIITPDCKWNWEIAKSIVQNADCNDSEYYRHLGLAHVLTEAFILATYRQLPQKHPLYILFTPNFEGTLFTNGTAVKSINQEGSYFNITEMIFSGTVPSTLGIAANAVHDVNFTENMVPNELRSRGVDDPRVMPNYPYRDDSMLIWNAINRWAADYVRIYYTSDSDVTGDYELQNWVREVSSQDGGRIKGVGEDGVGGRIATVSYLIDCVTAVIYTASAHHALTNFPLEDYEIYSPGWPGALYKEAPKTTKGATRLDWLGYLAPLNMALLQQALGYTVGGVYFTKLGLYPVCQFDDSRVRAPLIAFQQDLERIEGLIQDQNARRALRYPYLLPSRIPASTNI